MSSPRKTKKVTFFNGEKNHLQNVKSFLETDAPAEISGHMKIDLNKKPPKSIMKNFCSDEKSRNLQTLEFHDHLDAVRSKENNIDNILEKLDNYFRTLNSSQIAKFTNAVDSTEGDNDIARAILRISNIHYAIALFKDGLLAKETGEKDDGRIYFKLFEKLISVWDKQKQSLFKDELITQNLMFQYQHESSIIKLKFNYSKNDKKILQESLSQEIISIMSISELMKLYDKNIDKDFITQKRHKIYDSIRSSVKKNSYAASKINFIENLQRQALKIISSLDTKEFYESYMQIINSAIFSPEHYKNGVNTQDIFDQIQSLSKVKLPTLHKG